jgi:hypothetical protein
MHSKKKANTRLAFGSDVAPASARKLACHQAEGIVLWNQAVGQAAS